MGFIILFILLFFLIIVLCAMLVVISVIAVSIFMRVWSNKIVPWLDKSFGESGVEW